MLSETRSATEADTSEEAEITARNAKASVKYPRHLRSASPPANYVPLTPEQVRLKIHLLCECIRILGDDFTQAKLEKLEAKITPLVRAGVEIDLSGINLPPKVETRSATRKVPRETPSGRERDDAYGAVLISLSQRWRVIRCKEGIQYILQYCRSLKSPDRWEGQSYPTSREGVRDSIIRHVGREAADEAVLAIDSLPEHVTE